MKPKLLVCVFSAHFMGMAFAATFGVALSIIGGPSDLVLDEVRGRLYVVNSTQNRVDVYSTGQRRFLNSMATDSQPLAAALSRSNKYLYVTAYGAAALDVIDLDSANVVRRVPLPAAPEGVAVGADERVLITTIGSSSTDMTTNVQLYNPAANGSTSLFTVVASLSPPSTPSTPSSGQVYNASRSRLIATPDGKYIIGANMVSTSSQTVFVYESASATILRSRSVSNISSVLSVSPDGSRFMSGLSLFDTATLAITAQQNAANSLYPFQQNVNFNLQANQGGSVFSPDGSVLYSAFNVAPVQSITAAVNSSQLMLSDPDNLLIQLGLQLPENLTGKMVISSNGANIYALSQSGVLSLPVSTIYDNPIAVPDKTAVLLTNDQCGVTAATRTAQVDVNNRGKGRMTATAQVEQNGVTFTAPLGGNTGGNTGTGGIAFPGAGGAFGAGGGGPGLQIPITLPGGGQINIPPTTGAGNGITTGAAPGLTTTQQNAVVQNAPQVSMQQTGNGAVFHFSFNSGAASSLGTVTPADFLVQSQEAINIPARIRVYQNNRNAEAPGAVVAQPVSVSTSEGLVDLVADSRRNRLYIANSGLNRVEVFDTAANEFLTPIKVGQLPRSLALSPDGNALYVANTGGENISIIDLDKGQVTGHVQFPPLPFNASAALATPSVIAATLRGLQMVMSSGALWEVVNNTAKPRATSTVIGGTTLTSPRSMISTPGGEYVVLLAGSGVAYLYDAMSDEYVGSQTVATTPIQGYYGPMAAGPQGRYFVINGQLLNSSLTPIGSSGSGGLGGGIGATSSTASNVAALAAVNATTYARFSQPSRTTTAATVTSTPTVDLMDAGGLGRGTSSPALEGPLSSQVGTQRVNVSARTMAIDATGSNAYLLTASGLSIIPLTSAATAQSRVQVNPNGIVNVATYTSSLAPNGIAAIFGQNLASDGSASGSSLPSTLGGTCVTLDNAAVPLSMTSTGQINFQVPPETSAARHTLVVRGIDRHTASAQQSITVAKYAPAVYVNPSTGEAAVFHADQTPVSKPDPAQRDEPLTMFATGLGPTTGGKVTAGTASPGDPPALTGTVQVFFGNPGYKEAAIIVDWSGLSPGLIGIYELHLRVPGAHVKGDALPVTLKVGGVTSVSGPVISVQ